MKDQARVVIIGGGITGCSIAYHLAQMGWTDIMLLDKGELTSGSTFHSVGLVSQFRTSPAQMLLMNYSMGIFAYPPKKVYSRLEQPCFCSNS